MNDKVETEVQWQITWPWYYTDHMTMILKLPFFLDISFVEYAKYVQKIAIYILVKKSPNQVED